MHVFITAPVTNRHTSYIRNEVRFIKLHLWWYLIETIESFEIISSQHSRNNKHRYNFISSYIFYTRECKGCFSGFSPFPTLFLIFSILSWSCKNSIESSFVAFLLPVPDGKCFIDIRLLRLFIGLVVV